MRHGDLPLRKHVGATLCEAVSKLAGEHKVHPYLNPETLCRGESCEAVSKP